MGTGSTCWLCLGTNGSGVAALVVPGRAGAWDTAERWEGGTCTTELVAGLLFVLSALSQD